MADERNFRSSYYEKVGFRSVEEKKSLEMLLKDRPFDKGKLKQFCLRFTVPAIHRHLLWKILLRVIPVYEESQEFVIKQRKAEFEDLQKALKDAKLVDKAAKPSQLFLKMWLLRNKRTKMNINDQVESQLLRSMSRMAESLCNVTSVDHDDEKMVDIYWILSGFLDHIQNYYKDVRRLIECTCTLLEQKDQNLYSHLNKIGAIHTFPFEPWFYSCFAGTISDGFLTKIWDKVAVGAYKILVFVAVVTLTTLRGFLLRCESLDDVLDTMGKMTDETSEVIVSKAIELWQQSGSVLVSTTQNTITIVQNT